MEGSSPSDHTGDQDPFLGTTMDKCTICLETIRDSSVRSLAKLKCGHFFHLDCIGSAFNAKGSMKCPNCRHVEEGDWLYANGAHRHEDTPLSRLAARIFDLGIIGTVQPSEDRVVRQHASDRRFPLPVLEGAIQEPNTVTEPPVAPVPPMMRIPLRTCPFLVGRRVDSNNLVGSSHNTVESSPPLQIRNDNENSTEMPSSIQNRNIRRADGARHLPTSQNVQNLDVAASTGLSYERSGWCRSGCGNQVASNRVGSSRNDIAATDGRSYGSRGNFRGGHSRQVVQPVGRRRPERQLSGGTSYRANADIHGPRSIGDSSLSLHQRSADFRRARESDQLTSIQSDLGSLSHGSVRHGTREEPSLSSSLNERQDSNTQQFPVVRSRQPSSRRHGDGHNYGNGDENSLTASDPSCQFPRRSRSRRGRGSRSRQSTNDRNLCHHHHRHASGPHPMEGITFGTVSPHILQAVQRMSLPRGSHNSFEEGPIQHHHASHMSSTEELTQPGLGEPMSSQFGNSQEPQT